MKKIILLIVSLAISIISFSQSYTVQTVPNPKTEYNGWVTNPDNVISPIIADSINLLLTDLEKKTSIQAAVVIINSIGEEVPADFATELFNTWGIGVKGKDNGLLILMVYDQHRIEFRTGYGMESLLPDITCKRIQMNYMVPRFKEELYDQGMMDGIKATIDVLSNPDTSQIMAEMDARDEQLALDDPRKPVITGFVAGIFFLVALIAFFIEKREGKFKSDRDTLLPNHKVYLPINGAYWIFIYALLPLGLIGSLYFGGIGKGYYWKLVLIVYGYLIFILLENRIRSNKFLAKASPKDDYFARFQLFANENQYWFWAAIFFPFPFLFYWLYYKNKMKALRNHPRACQLCASPMKKLDEKSDDAFLNKSQVLEEGLESIDYDVWCCTACDNHHVLRFENVFSKYTVCPQCAGKTYYLDKDVTLVAATYDHGGSGQKTYLCKNCLHEEIKPYTTSRLTRSSSSSGSSGGGGSFGGGSSGGGGSGSSW